MTLFAMQRRIKEIYIGTGKMAQQLRLFIITEVLGLIPSTHVMAHNYL